MLLLGGIGQLFYGSFLGSVILAPAMIPYMKLWMREKEKRIKQKFYGELQDYLQALATFLKAGYSVENAIRQGREELKSQYGEGARIMQDTEKLIRKLEFNLSIEIALKSWAKDIELEEVSQFVTVFSEAKRLGGDSVEITKKTIRHICEKMEVKREIELVLTAKKMEFQVMSMIPIGILVYMKWSFPQFLDVLYQNVFGVIMMTLCLGGYGVAYLWGRRIVEIEV